MSSHCKKSSPCTSTDTDVIHSADKSTIPTLSTDEKHSRSDCTMSNKSVSSQNNADSVTCKKPCKSEPADGNSESADDLKCMTACSAEKQSKNDRRQRQGKRPDIQRYVPKPKQSAQHDPPVSSLSSAVDVKSINHSSFSELASTSGRKNCYAELSKSAEASLPQSSANLAPDIRKSSDRGDILEPVSQFHQTESTGTLISEHCNSVSIKSSAAASLSHDVSISASNTTDHGDCSQHVPDRVKQKVSKTTKSQNNEPKQQASEYIFLSSALRNAENAKRAKTSDRIRSEKLDFDFDGEYDYNLDGVSWGDLPPPSDHDWSDEETHDDLGAPTDSSTNAQKPKPRKPRGKRHRATRKKQTQNTGISDSVDIAAADAELINNSGNSNTSVQAGALKSTKLDKMVITASRSVDDAESVVPVHNDDRLSKHDMDDHYSGKVNTHSYLHSRRQKDAAERPHLVVRGESEQRTGSKEQRQGSRNNPKSSNRQHGDTRLMESRSKREETTERQEPDSGRVGGIIRLPVGTVMTASHDTAHSAPSQAAASTRSRNWRSAHGTAGRRALWSPDASESSQHQGAAAYDQTQLHAAYPAQGYHRHSTPPQVYYSDYPPVSGASQMPTADGYVYGYPQVAYDGLGYVDDSYYQ